jgi:hypothetical protein
MPDNVQKKQLKKACVNVVSTAATRVSSKFLIMFIYRRSVLRRPGRMRGGATHLQLGDGPARAPLITAGDHHLIVLLQQLASRDVADAGVAAGDDDLQRAERGGRGGEGRVGMWGGRVCEFLKGVSLLRSPSSPVYGESSNYIHVKD